MPITFRDYRPRVLGIATHASAISGPNERIDEGDILAVRLPGRPIGTGLDVDGNPVPRSERSGMLWILMEGLDSLGMHDLQLGEEPPLGSLSGKGRRAVAADGTLIGAKRRYAVPLDRLATVAPWFDVARARDRSDAYQPILMTDLDLPPSPMSYRKALATLQSEGQTADEARVALAPVVAPLRVRRLDRDRLATRQLFRLSDGSFRLTAPTGTYGASMSARAPLRVEGLVFDKARGVYL